MSKDSVHQLSFNKQTVYVIKCESYDIKQLNLLRSGEFGDVSAFYAGLLTNSGALLEFFAPL